MLESTPVMAFLAVADRERARTFYAGVLGLPLRAEDEYALVFDAAGTTLRISPVPGFEARPFTVLGWRLEDIRAGLKALEAVGVQFERYEHVPQDEDGVCTFADGTMVAWFKDPDGNVLSLTQFA
jgi:catechol 2,3-dioxygenase-like lactoylglutathione lyase family enzyme